MERVEETPFWETLCKGLRSGMASGQDWMLSLDADVLPSPDLMEVVDRWIREAERWDGVITGMVQDKLIAGIRSGGVRLFRAEVLPLILEVMPTREETVRPESAAIVRLAGRGWRHKLTRDLVGLHDYEQSYADIYRKAFLHMRKHDYAAGRFLPNWRKLATHDPDYQVALAGAGNALQDQVDVDCDAAHPVFRAGPTLERLGLHEKGAYVHDPFQVPREVRSLQEAMEGGVLVPFSPQDQQAYNQAVSGPELFARISRIGDCLKDCLAASPEAESAVLHQVRRILRDHALLDTFSPMEILGYARSRVFSSGPRRKKSDPTTTR
ncbi:MAG TPA: hypothetical protein PKE55_01015 [Kiritimatiellia bacterium]|nr:hypothetical protein [Kiritimatiellia bacterium]